MRGNEITDLIGGSFRPYVGRDENCRLLISTLLFYMRKYADSDVSANSAVRYLILNMAPELISRIISEGTVILSEEDVEVAKVLHDQIEEFQSGMLRQEFRKVVDLSQGKDNRVSISELLSGSDDSAFI